jgi:hypothetical protein
VTLRRKATLLTLAMLATVLLVTVVLPMMGQGHTNYEDAELYPKPSEPNLHVQNINWAIANPLVFVGSWGAITGTVGVYAYWAAEPDADD